MERIPGSFIKGAGGLVPNLKDAAMAARQPKAAETSAPAPQVAAVAAPDAAGTNNGGEAL